MRLRLLFYTLQLKGTSFQIVGALTEFNVLSSMTRDVRTAKQLFVIPIRGCEILRSACLSVCPFVCLRVSKTARANFTRFDTIR